MKMTHPNSDLEIDVLKDQAYQYETQGWVPVDDPNRPAGNASLEEWQIYATSKGVLVEGKTRDELRAELSN